MRSRRIIGVLTALGIILSLHPNISSAKPATGNAANEVVALESLRRVALISATLYPKTSFRPTGMTSAERDLASFERALAVRVRQAGGSVSQDNRLWHATTNAAPQVSALALAESNLHLIARTVNFANPKDQQRIAQWIDDPALLLHLGRRSKFVI